MCHGLAERSGMPVAQVRALTVLASLLFGIGVLAYLVCWLVLPTEGETAEAPALVRGLAAAALILTAGAALAALALLGGVATLFGFGWAVAVAVGVLVAGTLVAWPAIRPAWVLPPLVTLVLAAVAVAASGVRIEPQSATVFARPTAVADLPSGPYRAGLGDLLVDLRTLPLKAGQTVPIRIETGTGDTVVALPSDRCVNLEVRYRTDLLGFHLADQVLVRLSGGYGISPLVFFGGWESPGEGAWIRRTTDRRAPTVRIDFRSVRGGLTVRDYPERVAPLDDRNWPESIQPPLAPSDRRPEWHRSSRSPSVKRRWRAWDRKVRRFERAQRARRAGPCARTEVNG